MSKVNIVIVIMMGVITVVGSVEAHGLGMHMFLGSQTPEVWQNYDPDFYSALLSDDSVGVMTRKFYYIGLLLPDLVDTSFQKATKRLIIDLHDNLPLDTTITLDYTASANILGLWIRVPLTITARVSLNTYSPLRIRDETYNQVQQLMYFNGEFPNTNFQKLREMTEYARSQNWSPVDKALIYGAYMHVIQDLYAHMVLQPALFGYPYDIESDSVLEKGLLYFPELYYELFSQTYIPDWSFIEDLYKGYKSYWNAPSCNHFELMPYSFYTNEIRYAVGNCEYYERLGYQDWQTLDFTPVQRFIQAAQATGYIGPGLTQERLESYLHGAAILLYMTYGLNEADQTFGGMLSHTNWNSEDIIRFIASPFLDQYTVEILDVQGDAGHLGDAIVDVVADAILWSGAIYWFIDPTSYTRDYLLRNAGLLAQRIGHLANGSNLWYREWTYFFEGVQGLDDAVALWENDSIATEDLKVLRRELAWWDLYCQQPSPSKREFYEGEPQRALSFLELYRLSVEQGQTYLDYEPWSIARKAGILGGMWEIDPQRTYYPQPGVFDLLFKINDDYIYTTQSVSVEGPPTTIDLNYDLVTFGDTKVKVRGIREAGDTLDLAWQQLSGPDRKTGSLSFNAQDAVNEGADTVFFEVQTAKRNNPNQFTTMFQSDYREPYNTHPEIHENPYYQTYFVNGNPVRTQSQNPITDPAHYWPYVLPLKDTLTVLNTPSDLSASSEAPWTSVTLTWQDNSNYETGYEIKRRPLNGNWDLFDTTLANETSYTDNHVSPFTDYEYQIRAIAPGVSSDTATIETYTGPTANDTLATAPNNSPKICFSNNKIHIIFSNDSSILYSNANRFGNNWSQPITLNNPSEYASSPAIVAYGSNIAIFWISPKNPTNYPFYRVMVNYSNDNGESWTGPFELLSGSINQYVENYFLNLSAIYLGENGIFVSLGLYFDHSLHSPSPIGDHIKICKFHLNWGEQNLNSLDTLFDYEISTDTAPPVTGPSIGVKNNQLVIAWSINDSLYYYTELYPNPNTGDEMTVRSGYICPGKNPSLAADHLVYENANTVYYSRFIGSGYLDDWSQPQIVSEGREATIAGYGNYIYVFFKGQDGAYLKYKDINSNAWSQDEVIGLGNLYFPHGVVWDVSFLQDTAVPYRLDPNGGSGRVFIKGTLRRYAFTVYTASVGARKEVVFKKLRLSMPGFGGGPQEAGLKGKDLRIIGVIPNPSSGIVNLRMYLPDKRPMVLKVYDVTGRMVMKRGFDGLGPGRLEIPIDVWRLSSGVYFYQVEIGKEKHMGEFTLVR